MTVVAGYVRAQLGFPGFEGVSRLVGAVDVLAGAECQGGSSGAPGLGDQAAIADAELELGRRFGNERDRTIHPEPALLQCDAHRHARSRETIESGEPRQNLARQTHGFGCVDVLHGVTQVDAREGCAGPAGAHIRCVAQHGDGQPLIGIPPEEGAVTGRRSGVGNRGHAGERFHSQTRGIGDSPAVIQPSLFVHHAHELATAQNSALERSVPDKEVSYRGEQSPVSVHVFDRLHYGYCVAAHSVCRTAPLHDPRVVVPPFGVGHTEGSEDPPLRELGERNAAYSRDDDRQQVVSAVAVRVFSSRREIERALPGQDIQHVLMGVRAVLPAPTRNLRDAAPVAQTARVIQQVPQGDDGTVVRNLGNVLPNVVIERERAFEREQDNGRGGELLRDRSGLEDRGRRVGNVVLQVGHPVSSRQHGEPVHRYSDGATRGLDRVPMLEDAVDQDTRIGRYLPANGKQAQSEQPGR